MAKVATGGGRFDPHAPFLCFSAANTSQTERLNWTRNPVLMPMNSIRGSNVQQVIELLEDPAVLFYLDSGVFSLSMEQAKLKGITWEEARLLPLSEMDGFAELWDRYIHFVKAYAGDLWGYVEFDFGPMEQKRKLRLELEMAGLRPIPVFHMLSDPPEYLDELLETYDRVCISCLATTSRFIRLRVLATAAEKTRQHPEVWIHYLGLQMSELLAAYPANSTDSSAWLSATQWSGYIERAALRRVSRMSRQFQYRLGDRASINMGWSMGLHGDYVTMLNARQLFARLQ